MGDKPTIIDTAEKKSRLESILKGFSFSLDVIASRLGPVSRDRNLYSALKEINESISTGFAAVAAEIAKLKPSEPPPTQMRGTIMADYQVPADQPDGRVTFHISATDSEGNPITDPAELAKLQFEVVNSNDAAFVVTMDADQPDPANRVGGYHVGSPGQGTVTSNLKQADGDLIATGTDGFTVTTGEATLGSVTGTFEGLSPIG